MMRVDNWQLAVQPLDMRAGMDSMLARVVAVFGCAQPHTAYAFANARASRMKVLIHDGFGLWLCTRRLHQGSLHWPNGQAAHIELSQAQWQALSVGLPWQRLGAHEASIWVV
jgi:transposase